MQAIDPSRSKPSIRSKLLRLAVPVAALLPAFLATGCGAPDRDRDGIVGAADICPCTPRTYPVDENGCAAPERALDAGLRALLVGEEGMEIGEAWMLQQLAKRRPNDALLAELVERFEGELVDHRAAALLDPSLPRSPLPIAPGRGIARLAVYIFSPSGEPRDRAAAFIADFVSEAGAEYVLSHQFLVLEWSSQLGVALPPDAEEARADFVRRMVEEQNAAMAFDDLYAERAALILHAGSGDPAQVRSWVDLIVSSQAADGRWTSAPTRIVYDGQSATARHPWPHTTGFAVAATAFGLERSTVDLEGCSSP